MIPAPLDNRHFLSLGKLQIRISPQKLGVPQHRVHGGADFVAHVGQKRALGAIGSFGGDSGSFELFVFLAKNSISGFEFFASATQGFKMWHGDNL